MSRFEDKFRKYGRTTTLSLTVVAISLAVSSVVSASSHGEAPFIKIRPALDGSDFYMFMSYEPGREDFVPW